MANVLAFCEYSGSSLRSSALSNLNAARKAAEFHGGEVTILLIGGDAQAAADDAAKYAPKVITVTDAGLQTYMAETYAPIIARIAKEQSAAVIIATATAIGKDVLPRTAALLDAGMASDISEVLGGNKFKRPVMAGNAFLTMEVTSDTLCVTARQSAFDGVTALGSAGTTETADAGELNTCGAEVLRVETSKSDRPDLNDADIVVSGGRGMKEGENFKVLEGLADLLGAAMGASRAATDAGMVPADWQVGQTGKIVAPKLYFAVAISGAIQHLAGMKGSKTIVAINKDPEAPIFQVADYGLVSTWEEAIPALVEEVKKLQASQN